MDLISAGAQIVLFVTGRGSVIGSPIAPLIKVTGNTQTYQKMMDDMDFNAGRVLNGDLTLSQAGAELQQMVFAVAAGQQSNPNPSATVNTSSCTNTRTRRHCKSVAGHESYFTPNLVVQTQRIPL